MSVRAISAAFQPPESFPMLPIPPFRRLAAAFTLLILAPGAALSADPAAKAMIKGIYQTYMGKDAKGVPLDSPKVKTLLTPGLLRLIDADARRAARRNEPPELNGDPFVDAQDWDYKSYDVSIAELGPAKARATVMLTPNGEGRAKTITLDLVKTKAGWRIDNMTGPSGSVRGFLKPKRN
jgi:hypothetical protein